MKRRERRSRRILGIDPGSVFYGIIETRDGNAPEYVASGRICLGKGDPLHLRLSELHAGLTGIVKEFTPGEAVIERIFYAKGVKAALSLGHARGIAMLVASAEKLDIFEYSALQVKKSVVGYGRADKSQVSSMVTRILGIRRVLSEDSADALALALCHAHTSQAVCGVRRP
ncbi:MAG: crossover junction endodeoxyribonuclease RuvC [Thermodesulfovibrionales bacterium]